MRNPLKIFTGKRYEDAANIGGKFSLTGDASIIEAAAIEGEAGEGSRLPTFDVLAYTGAPMALNGYRFPVIIDLNGIKAQSSQIPVLHGHDDDRVVGHTTEAIINADGVRFKGVISGVGPHAKEVTANAKNGFRWQASVGAPAPNPKSVEHLAAGRQAIVNGRTVTGPMTIVRATNLTEFSFVARGADPNTSAAIAAQQKETDMTFEQWLQSKGLELAAVKANATLEQSLQASYKAEGHGDDSQQLPNITANGGNVDLAAIVAKATETAVSKAVADTTARIEAAAAKKAKIQGICAEHPDLAAKAVAEDWSEDKAELEVIRASRPRPIFATSQGAGAPDSHAVLECALMRNGGIEEEHLKRNFDDKTIEAALSSRLNGVGLQALMYETLRAAGRSVAPGVMGNELIRAAFEADRQLRASGVSQISLSGTLGNVANKSIVTGFMSTEQVWKEFANIDSTNDFKTKTSYRLTGDFTYEKIGVTGELPHGKMGEAGYANRLDTYGKIFGVNRETLFNDDLGAVVKTARLRLGRGSGLAINDVFWAVFMANTGFFTAGRGNFDDGADSAFGIDGLTAAEILFGLMTDEEGKPVGVTPKILLGPTQLTVPMAKVCKDLELRNNTANTTDTTGNPHAGRFRSVNSAYLCNATITGNSAKKWYLLADPKEIGVGVIEMLFLNGQQMPTIESSEADFKTLGIDMRGFHDFGAALQEYRLGVAMKGEV